MSERNSKKIKSLKQLYFEIEKLFPKINKFCQNCKNCCKSYAWLVTGEEELVEKPLLLINDSIYCVDSFKRKGKKVLLDKIPKCRHYTQFKCKIYSTRPLFCRLFPLVIESKRNQYQITLFRNCKYSKKISKNEKKQLKQKLTNLIKIIDKKLMKKILNSFCGIAKITIEKSKEKKEVLLKLDKKGRILLGDN